MMRLLGVLILFTAVAALVGPLTAGDDGRPARDIDKMFRKLDANKDGRLTRDEFLKIADHFRDTDKDKARTRLGQAFDKLDPEQRGLSRDQFRSFIETVRKKKDDDSRRKTDK
jgi:Ca2+-binding EF-hand superfamily protein